MASEELPKKRRGKPRNYINNPTFYQALVDYFAKCEEAKAEYLKKYEQQVYMNDKGEIEKLSPDVPDYLAPQIPRYIGECMHHLAVNLAKRGNFSGYSFKDEMISDAYVNCLAGLHAYNTKYENPFAYFTSACWNAFIRRIKLEKKEAAGKIEMLRNSGILEELAHDTHTGDDVSYDTTYVSFLLASADAVLSDAEKEAPTGKEYYQRRNKSHQKIIDDREEVLKSAENSDKKHEEYTLSESVFAEFLTEE